MSQAVSSQQGNVRPSLNEAGKRRIVQIFAILLVIAGILFAFAGRLDWWAAWIYLILYVASLTLNAVLVLRRNPDVINERGRPGPNVKGWDKTLGWFISVFFLAVYAVAGLDAGRNGWSVMPLAGHIVGLALVITSSLLTSWVMVTNTFLSTRVRIQEDRGHQVVTHGPYRIVRHPMYVATIMGLVGVALLLGSWWALVPAVICSGLFVVRTALEDRTLQAELPGYKDYAARTRYRLLPGVW